MSKVKIDTRNIAWVCRRCGRCCDPPTVTKKDIARICGYLKIPFKEFVDRYVNYFNGTVGELKGVKNRCIFLKGNRCSIYPVRPLICRLRPYSIQLADGQLVLTYDPWFLERCPGMFLGDLPPEEKYIEYGLLVAKYLGLERRTPEEAFKRCKNR